MCSAVSAGTCVDPSTGQEYVDKTVRCSLLNSGTPASVLCKELLGDSATEVSTQICAQEPSLLECKTSSSNGFRILLIILLGSIVLMTIIALLTKQTQDY